MATIRFASFFDHGVRFFVTFGDVDRVATRLRIENDLQIDAELSVRSNVGGATNMTLQQIGPGVTNVNIPGNQRWTMVGDDQDRFPDDLEIESGVQWL